MVQNFEILRVDMIQLRRVLIIHVDTAFAVGRGEFWLATHIDRPQNSAVGGVDGRGVLATRRIPAATVEGEDSLGNRLVENGVRVDVGLNVANGLQSFQVEDSDIVGGAITGKAAAEVGSNGDAVDAFCVRNIANDGVRIGVHNNRVVAVRNVDAAGGAVDVKIIPAGITGNRDGLDDVIAGRTWSGRGGARFEAGAED